jgi:hypothetical protein
MSASKQWVQLVLFTDSIWGRSELTVFVGEDDVATAAMEWRNEGRWTATQGHREAIRH